MDLQERFVSAFMGVIWGAVLGVLISLFFHFVVGSDFDQSFYILNWKNTILGCSGLFAVLGLLFKTSVATAISHLMNWAWNGIQIENAYSFKFNIFLLCALFLILFLYTKV